MSIFTIIGVAVSAWAMLSLLASQRYSELAHSRRRIEEEHAHHEAATVNARPPGGVVPPSPNAAGAAQTHPAKH
jgi:hypothetical protein